ncbi:DUF6090 family protein [Algoriphagus hitonicola]|uniref:Uncharacterized protein n=1 Tax=Algoriphagus hitonicola TaxID=435880 RepID=A0A1I2Q1Q8_9BACT|nr:DUF6090 family protein [Algoriphagus hitonicola]SFG22435.1 hypothetical protein SAMN04487988_10280 [Algoriphagus hitonicola]
MFKFFRNIRQQLLSHLPTGKVPSYLAYAVGEIFLVVIGILIALQINNWNEGRKQKRSMQVAIQSLIEDFKQDTLQLKQEIEAISKDLEILDGFRMRLSKPSATIDTLRQIARYEYIPFFDPSNEMNRNTIISLLSTGTVDYFDEELKAKILKYNSEQLKSIKIMDENVSIYLNTQYSFGLGIASQSGNPNSMLASVTINGPLSELYWANLDDKQLLESMLNTFAGKMVMNSIVLSMKKDLLDKTNVMLDYLHQYKK